MSKKQDPDEFFEARDEDAEWGAPIRVPKKKKNLSAMVSIRFSNEEFELIQKVAASQNLTISAYVRSAVLEKSKSGLPSAQSKTGSSISIPLSGTFSASSTNPANQVNYKYKVS